MFESPITMTAALAMPLLLASTSLIAQDGGFLTVGDGWTAVKHVRNPPTRHSGLHGWIAIDANPMNFKASFFASAPGITLLPSQRETRSDKSTAWITTTFTYTPVTSQGVVTAFAELVAQGVVTPKRGNCSGTAIGYVTYEDSLPGKGRVVLDASSGGSTNEVLTASVSFRGVRVPLQLSPPGTRDRYRDEASEAVPLRIKGTDFFWFKVNTGGFCEYSIRARSKIDGRADGDCKPAITLGSAPLGAPIPGNN